MLVEAVFTTGVHTLGAALLALFTTARVLLWAFLVAVAWFEIVEKPFKEEQLGFKKPKTVKQTPIELTATTLQQHDVAEAVYEAEHPQQQITAGRRWPTHIPPMSGVSEMRDDESVDQWSIWQNEGGHGHHTTPDGFDAEPIPSAAPARTQQPAGITSAPGAAVRVPHHGPRPADHDEAQVLAASTLGGNTDLIKEPAKHVVRHDPGGKKHVEKKPLLTRKIEKWFIAPYAQKCMFN